MKNIVKIFRFVKPYWKSASLNIFFNILSAIFSLISLTMVVPFLQILFEVNKNIKKFAVAPNFILSKQGISDYFYYHIARLAEQNSKVEALLYLCVMVVILFFLKNLFRYLAMFFLAIVRNGVVKDLRNNIYKKILILPLSYYNEQRKGDLMSRMTSDVQEIEWSIMSSLEMIFRDPLSILMFIVTLFFISPTLTILALVLLPITGYFIGKIGKSLKRTSVKAQAKLGTILAVIEETISGLRVIKAYNAINFSEKKFKEINRDYTRTAVRLYRKRDLASPLSEFLSTIVLVVIIWYGGKLVLNPAVHLDAEIFIMYIVIFSQLIVPAKSFTTAVYNVQKGIASFDRINQVMQAEEIIIQKQEAIPVKDFNKAIVYNNVSFSYNSQDSRNANNEQGTEVLKNINLKIEKGRSIALVGHSGGGKSTLVDLLPRFYDINEGEITIDGIPIKNYIIDDLRGLTGIVSQQTILFNDTIFNNIAFGKTGVSEAEVKDAARIANADEFINQMPQGYNTNIGDSGNKLSGGQRQRISIARAVLKNPPILILDEATSSLDSESERLVQEALLNIMKNRTSIVIAHRLSTVQHADEIYVLSEGRIVEHGTHNELIAANGHYKKLYELQMFV